MTGTAAAHRRPDGSASPHPLLDRVSLRARVGILAALVAAGAVVLVSAVAFLIVRVTIMQTLDENLLQRATSFAQSPLVERTVTAVSTDVLGAGDIKLGLLYANGIASSAEGPTSAPPLGPDELAVATGARETSTRTARLGRAEYRVVAVSATTRSARWMPARSSTHSSVASPYWTACSSSCSTVR